ncbi:FAD-dependent monooxygenase [Paenibacillus sp. 481]|nr:FAD-dependent monooxygenase [Paenibacillus sp. 481]
MSTSQGWKRAITIGGSIAGLLAARVLADYYEEVVIVERDRFPDGPENRRGTPQAFHSHRLLMRGKIILEELFPGYADDLLAQGAFSRENKQIQLHYHRYGKLVIPDEKDAGCSRALLEWVIRRRVAQLPNVRFITEHEVTSLQASSDGMTITGVYLQQRGEAGNGQPMMLETDMVCDTSGRSSKLGQWLQELGYEVPEPERVNVSFGYSSRQYKVPEHVAMEWSTILLEGNSAQGIATGTFESIENNIAQVLLFRAGGQSYPTTNADEYEQEIADLFDSAITDIVKHLEPLTAPRGFRVSACIRNHFEQMEHWPSGLLVMGDALCNFDPVYGQGMSVAAIEAEQLARCLQEQRHTPDPRFELHVLHNMQQAIEPAWWFSMVSDLRWSGVTYTGPVSMEGIAFAQDYFDSYLEQAIGQYNIEMFENYMMMTSLIISPQEVINPDRIAAVLAKDLSPKGRRLAAKWVREDGTVDWNTLSRILPSFI